MVNNIKGWSPDCLNASNTNKFELFVTDTETGEEYVGPWSDSVTVAAYCSQSLSWTNIIVTCVLVVIVVAVILVFVCRVGHWWVIKKDFFDKLGKELDAKFVLASVDSLEAGGGNNQHAGPEYELRQFDIRHGRDPGDTDTLLLRDSSAQPTLHKSASQSAQSDFTTSGFGGSSQGGCTTATLSSEGGRLHLGPPSEAGSAVSGYISMIGRADSTHSNYTQLGQGRARTSGPAHRGMSGSPGDRSSLPEGRPLPGSSPHLTTPEEEEGAVAASEPSEGQQQQLSLSEWNSFPGNSIVRTGGEHASAPPPERRMNGYVPALPLIPPTSKGGTQVPVRSVHA